MSENEHQDEIPSPIDSEGTFSGYEDNPQFEMQCRICSYIFFVDVADLQEEERTIIEERKKMLVNYCQYLGISFFELPAECSRRVFPMCPECETKIERFRKIHWNLHRTMLINNTISNGVVEFFHNVKIPSLLGRRRCFIRSDVTELSKTFKVIIEAYQCILEEKIQSGSRITSQTNNSQQAEEPMGEGEIDRICLEYDKIDLERKS